MPITRGGASGGPNRLPILTRKTVWLLTVLGSIAPSNGMVRRGWVLKPSNWLSRAVSRQSEGLVAQFGNGRFTRKLVFCPGSNTVKRSLGKGDCVVEFTLNNACTPLALASTGTKINVRSRNAKDTRMRVGMREQPPGGD